MESSASVRKGAGVGERLRLARVGAASKELREAGRVAEALGISRPSLYRYEQQARGIPLEVVVAAAKLFGIDVHDLLGDALESTDSDRASDLLIEGVTKQSPSLFRKRIVDVVPRIFPTPEQQAAYTLGVMDTAALATAEVVRVLNAVRDALLAPTTSPTPVASDPALLHDLLAKHFAASTPTTQAPTTGAPKRSAKGRRSG